MNKVTITTSWLILALAVITSCGPTLHVSSDYDRSVDFTSYKTFNLYDLKTSNNVNQLNRDRIAKYIKAEMIKKGFKESNVHPDLMVNAVTVIKNKQSLVAYTNYYGYGGYYRPYACWGKSGHTTVNTYEYKNGSLVIDVVDAKTKRMIWEGSATAEYEKRPQDTEATISNTVAKTMASFPAK